MVLTSDKGGAPARKASASLCAPTRFREAARAGGSSLPARPGAGRARARTPGAFSRAVPRGRGGAAEGTSSSIAFLFCVVICSDGLCTTAGADFGTGRGCLLIGWLVVWGLKASGVLMLF